MDKPTDWRSGTRRIFSNEFKLHMVELASKPNANVAQLAREHGVDNNLILNGYASGKEKDVFLVECLQLL
ncbi:putative transposase [Escherichia coli]|nr:putative transposase [Escherichia coli]